MPGTVERTNRFVWPAMADETNPDLKRSFVWEAETLRRAILDAVWRIAADGVTRECLADGAVPMSKFATAVQAALSLQDGAVTVLKLADGALTADATGRLKVEDLFATGAKFADGAVVAAGLAAAVGAYAIPAGTMVWFAAETVPVGWFECNGQEQRIATYPALAAACGTRWGTAAGGPLWFKLPDYRGYFDRGWAHGTTNDPDKATRVGGDHVGSEQGDAVKPHLHTVRATALNFTGPLAGTQRYVQTALPYGNVTPNVEQVSGVESRPKNKMLMKIIKA
jgi:microcystin-dependent protein